jgi:hypothetical protein
LLVLSCPQDKCKEIDEILASFSASRDWFAQPAFPSTYQLQTSFKCPAGVSADLASEFFRRGIVCEIESRGAESERYLVHPRLGIHRQSIDSAGEQVIRFGQVQSFISQSQGNMAEFARLIRMAEGQAWFDVFEPLRVLPEGVRLLPKAV